MIRTTTAAVALFAFSAPAIAQEVTYLSFGTTWTQLSLGSDDLSSTKFEGDLEYSFDQFLFGLELHSVRLETMGEGTLTTFKGFAGYAPLPEALIGAGFTHLSEGGDFGGDDVNGFEILAQYRAGMFGGAVVYARPDNDNDDLSITSYYLQAEAMPGLTFGAVFDDTSPDYDATPYVLSVDYAQGPISGRAFYHGITDFDGSYYGVTGAYEVMPQLSLTAAIANLDEFIVFDANAYSVGAAYEISEGIFAEASFGQLMGDGPDIDVISLSLTYAIGDQTRFHRSMQSAASADRTISGLSVFLPDFGFSGTGYGL